MLEVPPKQPEAGDPNRISTKTIPPEERLIFALDVPNVDEAKRLVETLREAVIFYKVGLELFATGKAFDLIAWLVDQDKKVFADLKLFDVPETVRSAVRQLRNHPITFTTVHGNDGILEAACRDKGDLKILAVTVLTSLDQGDLRDLGFEVDVHRLVLSRARRALEIGCDGVVSSGLEARALKDHLGERLLIVTPASARSKTAPWTTRSGSSPWRRPSATAPTTSSSAAPSATPRTPTRRPWTSRGASRGCSSPPETAERAQS